jgi:CRISPR-associated protein Cst1
MKNLKEGILIGKTDSLIEGDDIIRGNDSKDSYFVLTGNPFVDAGIYAIERYYDKELYLLKPNELETKIDEIVNLYMSEGWKKNMYSIFTGNSNYTNPSLKGKKEPAIQFLNDLLGEFSIANKAGSCIACGRREALPIRKRDQVPLTGSGKLVNYFSGASEGERYCPVCTFTIQFIPLFLYSVGGKFLLFHSVSDKIMKYWAKEGIENIHEQKASGNYKGCMQDKYKNGENALFHIIEKIIINLDDIMEDENPSITAYIFSNYGQNPPPMSIIHLPNRVFRFLVYVKRIDDYSWKKVINKGYGVLKKEEDYKWKNNTVYKYLLSGKSIIAYFINKDRSVIGNWNIFSYYLKEVKVMDEKRINVLKKIGDKISNYIQHTDNTKRLFALETAKSYEGIRNVLLKITKDMIANGMDVPLFTTDELLNDLFPEGALGWKETRDILLFRIYEKLSDYFKSKKEIVEEIKEDEEA